MVLADRFKRAARKEATEQGKTQQAKRLYLKGVEAYKNNDYETAIYYWGKVLELDPNNQKAREGLARAKQKLEGPVKGEKHSEPYLKGVDAYKNGRYNEAAAYFYLASLKGEKWAKENLEKAQRKGGNVDDGMAALRLQNLPPPIMEMVVAYYNEQQPKAGKENKRKEKPSKAEQPKPTKTTEPSLTLLAYVDVGDVEGKYRIYVDSSLLGEGNKTKIDRKAAIGKTNLDPYAIREKYEKGEETNWEGIIMNKVEELGGTYIGALVNDADKATGVYYLGKDGNLYFLTWEFSKFGGQYHLRNGKWLQFKTTKLDGNGEMGIYVKKMQESPALTKLKKEFKEAGLS